MLVVRQQLVPVASAAAALLAASTAVAQGSWEDAPDTEPPPAAVEPPRPIPAPPPPLEATPAPAAQAEADGQTRIVLETEPPPAVTPRAKHRHEGFYLRLDAGIDLIGGRADFDDGETLRLRGGGLVLDLMIGGTPTAGLTVGGGFWLAALDEPRAELDQADDGSRVSFQSSTGLAYALIGPFVDVHPDPRRGFHFGAGFGLGFISLPQAAEVELPTENDRARLVSPGAGLTLLGGYDFWVSANWSLGAMLRVTAIRTRQDDELEYAPAIRSAYSASTNSLALLFTALYH